MLKRSVWRPIALSILVILLLAVAVFFYFLLVLDILPVKYLIPIIAVFVLLVTVSGLLLFYRIRKKRSPARRVRRIIGVVLSVLLIAVCVYGSVVLNHANEAKHAVVAQPENNPKSVVGIYVKSDDKAKELSEMASYRYAVLPGLGDEMLYANYALVQLKDRFGTPVDAVPFAGIADAADALISGDIQALAVSKGFLALLSDTEGYEEFEDSVRLIEEIVVPRTATLAETPIQVEKTLPTPSPTPEPTPEPIKDGEDRPLVFYLSGMDKEGQEIEYNAHADVNLLMAINPMTKQVLIVSTPRDTFVMNYALGGGDKLTHCAIQGVSNSIAALEDLYDTHVDNYCRINFTGFADLGDLIGGITVDNPTAFHTDYDNGDYYFEAGTITLDGYQALCYARERHAFGDGDLARGRNQARVITAMLNKAKTDSGKILVNHAEILKALAGTFETDLSPDQISDLVKVAIEHLNDWEIKTYSMWGGSGIRTVASMGLQEVAIIWPNANSVAFAAKLLAMIADGEVITDELLDSAPRF